MNLPLLKMPSAFLPIAMAVAALAVVLVHVVLFGTASDPDEGAAAHVFQLLVAGQVLLAGYFALRWLPTQPRQALWVLAFQVLALLLSCVPVFALGL